MNEEKLWSDIEVKAVVGAALSEYFYTLHFNKDFAERVAEAIKVLDEEYSDDPRRWQFHFGDANTSFVDYVVETIANARRCGTIE
jgi:hypothetical protein